MTKYLLLIASLLISLVACTPHKIDIEQGNILKPEMLKQLEIGMSRSQVEFILGTPVIRDTFNVDRWDYIYNFRPNRQPVVKENLSLIFKGNYLVSMSGSALEYITNLDRAETTDLGEDQAVEVDQNSE